MALLSGYFQVNNELRKAAISKNWKTMSIVRWTFFWSSCLSIDVALNDFWESLSKLYLCIQWFETFIKIKFLTHWLKLSVQIHYWCTALMWKVVKMPIADWLSYPPPLYINIGFGLSISVKFEISAWKQFISHSQILPY